MKGKPLQQTEKKLDKHCGDSVPSFITVYIWFQIFWSDYVGTSDVERSGRHEEVTTPEIIRKLLDMVMDRRRVKVHQIASSVGISSWNSISINFAIRTPEV
uniref:Histonelysine Nmethyltransferase SETMARlike [Hydra vulgaris] n=1 Tax=Lepeophtheirus salmonis TaxID=72036 RepID=A0A0K2TKA3_LEPSM